MSYTYLGKQNREEDLKKLDSAQCDRLCAEIRQELLERVTQNGGHLASNLGVVEHPPGLFFAGGPVDF